LAQSVIIPEELLDKVEKFIKEKDLGFTSKEEFFRGAARRALKVYDEELEFISLKRHKYQKLEKAIDELNLPYTDVDEFFEEQTDKLLDQYDQWLEQKQEE